MTRKKREVWQMRFNLNKGEADEILLHDYLKKLGEGSKMTDWIVQTLLMGYIEARPRQPIGFVNAIRFQPGDLVRLKGGSRFHPPFNDKWHTVLKNNRLTDADRGKIIFAECDDEWPYSGQDQEEWECFRRG